MSKVAIKSIDECWEWLGSKSKSGYGKFSIGRKDLRAHRQSYEIHHGQIPDGFFVLHSCDNRGCVNPYHLSVGTAAQNSKDMVTKGRSSHGEGHGAVIWSDDIVCGARSDYCSGVKKREILAKYGITVGIYGRIFQQHYRAHLWGTEGHPTWDEMRCAVEAAPKRDAKFTNDQVIEMRRQIAASEETCSSLARKLGVSNGSISCLNRGISYSHIRSPR